jgi:hydroxyacylglutathione hydrolase
MYLLVDDATQEAAVVDPYDAVKISNGAKEQGVKVRPPHPGNEGNSHSY